MWWFVWIYRWWIILLDLNCLWVVCCFAGWVLCFFGVCIIVCCLYFGFCWWLWCFGFCWLFELNSVACLVFGSLYLSGCLFVYCVSVWICRILFGFDCYGNCFIIVYFVALSLWCWCFVLCSFALFMLHGLVVLFGFVFVYLVFGFVCC